MKSSLTCGLLAAVCVCALTAVSVSTAQETDLDATPRVIAAKGAWSKTVTYAKDDIVTARGSAWRSKVANNKNHVPGSTTPNTAAFWEAFAVGFNPTGAWSSSHIYQPNELATYQGQTWRAKLTNTNTTPVAGTKWDLLVTKGAAGAKGATGAQGPAGPNTGVGAGTQTAPSISFSGDPNTGLYHPGADQIALVEGGALFLHNIGGGNTALGKSALATSTGNSNTAMGNGALSGNTDGSSNVAVGNLAMQTNTSGSANVAIGSLTLQSNTFGDYNIAIGSSSLNTNSTGSRNIAIGGDAMFSNTTGDFNTTVGLGAMYLSTAGGENVAIGYSALDHTQGSRNTVAGKEALTNATTGSKNIAIGYQAGISAPVDVSNSIFIGNSGAGTTNNDVIIGNGSHTRAFMGGISGIGVTGAEVYINSVGQLGVAVSSRRFKQDIEPVIGEVSLLDRMQPVSFRYKQADTDGSKPLQFGLIAEDVEAISRDLVVYDKDGRINTVKYHFLPPLLLAGYQAQQKTITAQAEKIDELEARLRKLETLLPQTKAASLQ